MRKERHPTKRKTISIQHHRMIVIRYRISNKDCTDFHCTTFSPPLDFRDEKQVSMYIKGKLFDCFANNDGKKFVQNWSFKIGIEHLQSIFFYLFILLEKHLCTTRKTFFRDTKWARNFLSEWRGCRCQLKRKRLEKSPIGRSNANGMARPKLVVSVDFISPRLNLAGMHTANGSVWGVWLVAWGPSVWVCLLSGYANLNTHLCI